MNLSMVRKNCCPISFSVLGNTLNFTHDMKFIYSFIYFLFSLYHNTSCGFSNYIIHYFYIGYQEH